jgi:UDP-3-O-[3-hydroxymyristoyl] glucosamine N-acyltransferase
MRLSEIAAKLSCELRAESDPEILHVAGIDEAGPGDLTFVSNRRYVRRLRTTRASAVILGYDIPETAIPSLRTSNPYLAFAQALELFFVRPRPDPGIHPTAVIAPDATIGANPTVGAFAVVGPRCVIGGNVVLHPHVVLYPDVELGDDVELHAHVVVREACRVGNRVVAQNGAVIGSDGFGFAPRPDGSYLKIAQTGPVVIEDDVEIGANTTVDRAAVGRTIIHRGAKLDNLVQIGHGSSVGEDSVLAAQVGVAGSSVIGRGVKLGGQVGLAGHLEIGDGAVVYAQSGLPHDVEAGAVVAGYPAIDAAKWSRAVTAFPKLAELMKRVRDLEKEVSELKGPAGTDSGA